MLDDGDILAVYVFRDVRGEVQVDVLVVDQLARLGIHTLHVGGDDCAEPNVDDTRAHALVQAAVKPVGVVLARAVDL